MIRKCFFLALILTAALAMAESKEFFREVDARGLKTVSVENVNGEIVVGVWDRELVQIKATIKGTESERKGIEIKVETHGDRLDVETDHSKRYFLGFIPMRTGGTVNYDIRVPSRINLETESVNGGIEVTGMSGNITIETVNGNLEGMDLDGSVKAESVNGSISLVLTSRTPHCNVDTINGSVTITIPSDASCSYNLETINGRINFALKDIEVKGAGPKELSGTLGDGDGSISVDVINGSVTIKY